MRVSVVIPVFNEAGMIGPCLDALLRQTVAPDELVVVDNNSTDATVAALAPYGDQVRLVREPRQGVQHARTAGFDAATGDVLGRIDADTRVGPRWVEGLHTVFADPAIGAATGPVSYYDMRLPRLVGAGDRLLRWICARTPDGLDWLYGANMAVRAGAWRTVRNAVCHDPALHEDLDLGIHLYAAGRRIVYAPELAAGTSGRRIQVRRRDFRDYLLTTEHGIRTHDQLTAPWAVQRAWLSSRLMLMAFHPLLLLHRLHPASARAGTVRVRPMDP